MVVYEEWSLKGLYRRPAHDDGATAPEGHLNWLCLVTSSRPPQQASSLEARLVLRSEGPLLRRAVNVIGHLCSPLVAHSFTSCDGPSSRVASPEVFGSAP